jgi:hypothetical protein
MELIFFDEVTSGTQASFTISNIPQTFKSLLIKTKFRTDVNDYNAGVNPAFNGDSVQGNYIDTRSLLQAAYARNLFSRRITGTAGAIAETYRFLCSTITIVGYSSSVSHTSWHTLADKVVVSDNAFGTATDFHAFETHAGVWKDTAALTSITLTSSGNFVVGSQLSVYGLK